MSPSTEATQGRLPLRGLLLRLGVAGAGLAVAFRLALPEGGAPLATLASAWSAPATSVVAAAGVATLLLGLAFCAGARRFQELLAGAGVDAGIRGILRAYVIASFFNIVLPGAILGDAYRVWDAREGLGRGSTVLGLVGLERLLSLTALGAIGLAAAPFLPRSGETATLGWVLVGLAGIFFLATLAALHPATNAILRRPAEALGRVSRRLASAARGTLDALAQVAARPRVVMRALGWSLLSQLLPVFAVFALAFPMQTGVGLHWFLVIVPFVTLVSLAPISIGGAGVRESLYVALFGAVGMRPEAALALSLAAFAISLVWGGVGLALFMAGRSRSA